MSWFNRKRKTVFGSYPGNAAGSSTAISIFANSFTCLLWANDMIDTSFTTYGWNSVVGNFGGITVTTNGNQVGVFGYTSGMSGSTATAVAIANWSRLTDGLENVQMAYYSQSASNLFTMSGLTMNGSVWG